jgi:multidrug efflux system outer membrane protein
MKIRTLLGAFACLAIASCAIKDPPAGAEIAPESARAKIPGKWSASHRSGPVVPNWIRTFNDPHLTALVADAVERNPDLRAAAARVEASRHAVRVAASSLYPRIAMKGLGERSGREIGGNRGFGIDPPDLGGLGVDLSSGSPDTSTLDSSSQRWVYGLGIGAAWEADVWGRVRSKKAAAKAESAALEADYEFARQSLAAAVARAYFSTIEAAQQEANAQETLHLYQEYSKLTEERREQGHASDFELAQVKSRTAGAKDTLFAAQAARAQAIRAIAGIPAEILERRPDLVAAERRFAAAFHRTNEARTARLPRFSLSASAGMGTAQLDTVGVIEAVNWSLAAGVVQPIFFGGELKAAQDIRTAEQRAAAATYVGTALRAFEDVESALANDYYLRQREGALGEMVSTSADAVKLGRSRLGEGQEDMFTILRLAGENLAAKIQLTQIRAARLRERVNLHLALGGDFKGTGAPGK